MESEENNIEQCIEHCLRGQPTKYDREIHIPLLVRSFYKGLSVEQFCKEVMISKATFYKWMKKHKDFKNTYEIAINAACDYWEQLPFQNPEINYPYYLAVMRHRFGLGKSKFNLKGKDTLDTIFDSLQESLDNQEITPQDLKQISDSLVVKILDRQSQEAASFIQTDFKELEERVKSARNIEQAIAAYYNKKVNA